MRLKVGSERNFITSDIRAKFRQNLPDFGVDEIGLLPCGDRPRGPPKSHLFLGESAKQEAYKYTTFGRRTEILVPRQIRFQVSPMNKGTNGE